MARKILISEFSKGGREKPDFKNTSLSKEKLVLSWLIEWVESELARGAVEHGDTLPLKPELAKFFDVSTGTVQNALRYAEDLGYFESKQRIGTIVRDRSKAVPALNKMFSKKDKAGLEIRKLLLNYECGELLPNVRKLSGMISTSPNTTRLALDSLVSKGILEQKPARGNESCWQLKTQVQLENWEKEWAEDGDSTINNKTLAKKLESEIKKFIKENYKINDKIPSNEELSKHFQVSIRTVNDAMKTLQSEGVVLSRRGQYGTIYIGEEVKTAKDKERTEKSIFMTSPIAKQKSLPKNSYLYNWEIALRELKKHIIKSYEAGDKIPPMREIAQTLKMSTNTVRTAVYTLCEQNILHTQRGKYGGTYVVNMPENDSDAFTWLALNPKFVENIVPN